MPIRLVTLDCANTLLRGSWDPVGFALWAAQEAGLCLPKRAGTTYGELLKRHYPTILEANKTADYKLVQREYVKIGRLWLAELDVNPDIAEDVVVASERLLLGPLFEPFEDTVTTLQALRERGIRLAVVSNWDASLPLVLAAHGLNEYFQDVFASLVVDAEKPDPKMIHLAMASAGAIPEETIHIGDDPVDDLGAARNAGVTGILLNRLGPRASAREADDSPLTITNLAEFLSRIP